MFSTRLPSDSRCSDQPINASEHSLDPETMSNVHQNPSRMRSPDTKHPSAPVARVMTKHFLSQRACPNASPIVQKQSHSGNLQNTAFARLSLQNPPELAEPFDQGIQQPRRIQATRARCGGSTVCAKLSGVCTHPSRYSFMQSYSI